jgi:hypothetical protein
MERVGFPRGIDGRVEYGHGPAIMQLLRNMTAAISLSMAGALQAQELPRNPQSTSDATSTPDDHMEEQLDRWMAAMDNNTYNVREEAWHAFIKRLQQEYDSNDTAATLLLQRMRTTSHGEARAISPEQRLRLSTAEEAFHAWKLSRPNALALGSTVSGEEALRLLQEKIGLLIIAPDDILATLAMRTIDVSVPRNKRTIHEILGTLCVSTHTKPQQLSNGTIELIPLEKDERLVWSNDLLGVLTTDAHGKKQMSLAMELGRGVMLSYTDHRGGFAPGLPNEYVENPDAEMPPPVKQPLTVDMLKNGRPDWTRGSPQSSTYRTVDSIHPTRVRAIVADMPASVKLTPIGVAETIGPQTIEMHQPEQLENGTWRVTIDASVFGDVPWPPTPCAWDALTYSLAHANRYVANGSDGTEIPTTITDTSFNMRCMTVTLTCHDEPTSLTVHAFRRMALRTLELPNVTPPTPPPAVGPTPFVPQVKSPK